MQAAVAVEAHRTGVPTMRPMLLEFPDDPATPTVDRHYLLGPDLLVAPVFSEDGVVREGNMVRVTADRDRPYEVTVVGESGQKVVKAVPT